MNEKNTSEEPMSQGTVAMIAAIMLVIGFGLGYFVFGGSTQQTNNTINTTTNNNFVFDQAKVDDITNTFKDYFYVYSNGEATANLVYNSYQEDPNYITLVYTLNGQPFKVSISKDYKYLYPTIISYDDFKQQVSEAKASLEEEKKAEAQEMQKTEKPTVLLFVMSFCPWGNVAEDAMAPVLKTLGSANVSFEPVFIFSRVGDGSWRSLHGPQELNQDVREKIIYNLYGPDKWMEYAVKVNARCNYTNADNCWKGPAEEVGINVTEVEAHFNNATEYNAILERDESLTNQYRVSASPTLIINGKVMNIARTPESFKSAICSAYLSAPASCNVTLSAQGPQASGSCG